MYYSSTAQVTFQKSIGDFNYNDAASIQQTADGGFIMAGTCYAEAARIYVIKTDASGGVTWAKFYSHFGEIGTSVNQTVDGGYIVCGYYADVPFSTYLLKINAAGDTLWSRVIHNDNHDLGLSVIQSSDGNYVTAGVTTDGVTYINPRLTKLAPDGTTIWNKGYTGPFNYVEEIPYSVKQNTDEGYIMAGYINNTSTMQDMALMKTDSGGTYRWNRWYGGNDSDYAWSVQPTSEHGFIMAGETKSFGAGAKDIYLVKADSTGDTLWTRTFGGTGIDVGKDVVEANDGGYVVAGYTESFGVAVRDMYVIKVSAGGTLQWSHTFGGIFRDEGASIQKTTDGGYIVAGYTESFGQNGEVYLVKLDSAGNSVCNEADAATITGYPASQTGTYNLIHGFVGSIDSYRLFPGNGGTATPVCTVGLSETDEANALKIYPNPVHGEFKVKTSELGEKKVTVYDVTGRTVLEEIILSQQSTIHCSLAPGLYLVRVEMGKMVWQQRLVVE
jgi:hypothetical protein